LVIQACRLDKISTAKGIYVSRFDAKTGRCGEAQLVAESVAANFLAVHPTLPVLYGLAAGSETSDVLCAWKIQADNGELHLISKVATGGLGSCHVQIHPAGKLAAVAHYNGGSVASFRLAEDGRITTDKPVTFHQHEGHSVNPKRQDKPYAHCAVFSPSGESLLVADLGTDEIFSYSVNPADAVLTLKSKCKVTPGAGPRHVCFHPQLPLVFSNDELLLNVRSFEFDGGELKPLETVGCMLPEAPGTEKDTLAEILCHPNGRFVYTSLRGADQIVCLSFDMAQKQLKRVSHTPSGGKVPRNFTLDPSGRWLIAAHARSPQVTFFSIDPESGALRPTGQVLPTDACLCVRMVKCGSEHP
jgi:6-phosphogluconolactonase